MITPFEQALLVAMLFFIMLGMGATMTPRDFTMALRRPTGLAIGFVNQFGLMPLLAFTLAVVLKLPPELAIGALIMGCVPSGTTSNIFTYFSKGNLALSVLMTASGTLFGIVLMPVVLYFYASRFTTAELQVPMENIVVTLAILIVPVVAAMVIRRRNANVGAVLELMGGVLGIVVILLLIASWVPRNWQLLMDTSWQVYFTTIGLGFFGIMLGYGFAKLLRLHPRNARTVALEAGIQNGPLAIGIVLLTFPPDQANRIMLVPALYSLFIVIVSTLVTLYFRRANEAAEQKIPDLL